MSRSYKIPDVRELADEKFPQADFPAQRGQAFRVYFSPGTHAEILRHASEDTSVEICGVLVGGWQKDEDGPFVEISNFIRADAAASKFAEVTFTHDSWSKINEVMDEKYSDLRIVGWYHSHPDFGIFLSDRDVFIQENFFSGPGQIAHVVDPVRKTEGVFVWRGGKPKLCPHYWIGDNIFTEDAAGSKPAPGDSGSATPRAASEVQAAAQPAGAPLPMWVAWANFALVFVLGFLLSGWLSSGRARWEEEAMFDRFMQEYAMFNVMRPGLREEMQLVEKNLAAVTKNIRILAKEHMSLADEEVAKEKLKEWNVQLTALQDSRKQLITIDRRFGFSKREQESIARYVATVKAAQQAKQKMRLDRMRKLEKQLNSAEVDENETSGDPKKQKEPEKTTQPKTPSPADKKKTDVERPPLKETAPDKQPPAKEAPAKQPKPAKSNTEDKAAPKKPPAESDAAPKEDSNKTAPDSME